MEPLQVSILNNDILQAKIEALLFASGDALSYRDLARITEQRMDEIMYAVECLSETYEEERRGIQLIRMEKTCQLSTKPAFFPEISNLLGLSQSSSLSKAAMETLSIIAYKQPTTRVEIEMLRGVSSSSSIQLLLDKGLITEAGRKDAPGRPFLYKTTDVFLKTVKLQSLSELPSFDLFSAEQDKKEDTFFELSE